MEVRSCNLSNWLYRKFAGGHRQIERPSPCREALRPHARRAGANRDFAQVFRVYPDDKYKKASYRNIAEVIAAEAGNDGVVEFHPTSCIQHADRQRRHAP